jgi:hypothetical protein
LELLKSGFVSETVGIIGPGGLGMDAKQIYSLRPKLKKLLKQFDDCFARPETRGHPLLHEALAAIGQLYDVEDLAATLSNEARCARPRLPTPVSAYSTRQGCGWGNGNYKSALIFSAPDAGVNVRDAARNVLAWENRRRQVILPIHLILPGHPVPRRIRMRNISSLNTQVYRGKDVIVNHNEPGIGVRIVRNTTLFRFPCYDYARRLSP